MASNPNTADHIAATKKDEVKNFTAEVQAKKDDVKAKAKGAANPRTPADEERREKLIKLATTVGGALLALALAAGIATKVKKTREPEFEDVKRDAKHTAKEGGWWARKKGHEAKHDVKAKAEEAKGKAKGKAEEAKGALSKAADAVHHKVDDAVHATEKAGAKAKHAIVEAPHQAKAAASSAAGAVKHNLVSASEKSDAAVRGAADKASREANKVGSAVHHKAHDAKETAVGWGKDARQLAHEYKDEPQLAEIEAKKNGPGCVIM